MTRDLLVVKILSIPFIKIIDPLVNPSRLFNNSLKQLLIQLSLSSGQEMESNLELLLISQKEQGQIPEASVGLYFLYRSTSQSEDILRANKDVVEEIISRELIRQGFVISLDFDKNKNDLYDYFTILSTSSLQSIVKQEILEPSQTAFLGYYYLPDFFPENLDFPINEVVNTLSQNPGCAVSFQLFPTQIQQYEVFAINEIVTSIYQLMNIKNSTGNLTYDQGAEKSFEYYKILLENISKPQYLFNISVFGNEMTNQLVTNEVISLFSHQMSLKIRLQKIDLSREEFNFGEELVSYPWRIENLLVNKYRNPKIWGRSQAWTSLKRLPMVASVDEVASFFRLPINDGSVMGIKSHQPTYSTEHFSSGLIDTENVSIGKVFNREGVTKDLGIPLHDLTKHMLIVGAPGSGKTTSCINILSQLWDKFEIPFLVVEPSKTEFRSLIDQIKELQIITAGNDISPLLINPFIPPAGIERKKYQSSLLDAFSAVFSMGGPLEAIFAKTLNDCFIRYGWKENSILGDSKTEIFGLNEFIVNFQNEIKDSQYSSDVKGNLTSGGTFRLRNLIEQVGSVFDTIHSIPIGDLLTKPTVIELDQISNSEHKALIMALLLVNVILYTKKFQLGDGKLKNVFLLDEAHVLLSPTVHPVYEGRADPSKKTIHMLTNMLAEIRSVGTGIIISDQLPVKVGRDVISNTDAKVVFRLTDQENRDLVGSSLPMTTEMKDHLMRLKPGEAYFFFGKLMNPQFIVTPDIREKTKMRLNITDKEISENKTYWDNQQQLLRPYYECQYVTTCPICNKQIQIDAKYLAQILWNILKPEIQKMKSKEEVFKRLLYTNKAIDYLLVNHLNIEPNQIIINCIKAHLLHICLPESNLDFSSYKQLLKHSLYFGKELEE